LEEYKLCIRHNFSNSNNIDCGFNMVEEDWGNCTCGLYRNKSHTSLIHTGTCPHCKTKHDKMIFEMGKSETKMVNKNDCECCNQEINTYIRKMKMEIDANAKIVKK